MTTHIEYLTDRTFHNSVQYYTGMLVWCYVCHSQIWANRALLAHFV